MFRLCLLSLSLLCFCVFSLPLCLQEPDSSFKASAAGWVPCQFKLSTSNHLQGAFQPLLTLWSRCCCALAVLLAMEDVRAVLVKLACRVDDMKTICYLPQEKQVCILSLPACVTVYTVEMSSGEVRGGGPWSRVGQNQGLACSLMVMCLP